MRKYLIPGPTTTTTRCIAEVQVHDDGGEISAFRFGNVFSSPPPLPPAPFFHGKGNYSHATDGRTDDRATVFDARKIDFSSSRQTKLLVKVIFQLSVKFILQSTDLQI